jgi:tetratricopeptide (TPR) repeat protein
MRSASLLCVDKIIRQSNNGIPSVYSICSTSGARVRRMLDSRAGFMLVFGLVSFLGLLLYMQNRKMSYLLLSAVGFLLSLFSHEAALVLPAVFILYIRMYHKDETAKSNKVLYGLWGISYVLYFMLRLIAVSPAKSFENFGLMQLLKNLPAIPVLIGKLILPINLTTMPLFDAQSIAIGLIVIAVVAVAVIRAKGHKDTAAQFGGMWLAIFLVAGMLYRLPMAEVGLEYQEYQAALPLIGILIALIPVLTAIRNKYTFKRILIFYVPLSLIFVVIGIKHSVDYYEPFMFYTSAIQSSEKNLAALVYRGEIFSKKIDKIDAIADFEKANFVCPQYSQPYAAKARVFSEFGKNAMAEKMFALALMADTTYPQFNGRDEKLYYELAVEKIMAGKYDEGLVCLKKGAVRDTLNAEIYNAMGYVYSLRGHYDSVIVVCTKAIAINPNSAVTYYDRARAKYYRKDISGALQDIGSALMIDSHYGDAFLLRGLINSSLGKSGEAISDFTASIKYKSNNPDAYFYRGNEQAKTHNMPQAQRDWQAAQQLGFKK